MSRQLQITILVVLLVIGAVIWGWQYWPSAESGSNGGPGFLQGYQALNFPESRLHKERTELRRKAEYKGSGVNPFSTIVPPSPQDVAKVNKDREKADRDAADRLRDQQAQQAQIVELPPNMKFFGYGTVPNGTPRRAFLSYQDDVYIVTEGDTLLGRYRIVKINNSTLEFEEVSSGRHGQKALEDQGPSA